MPALAANFTDSDAAAHNPVGFQSSWRQSVETSDADMQTDELQVAHQRTQHPKCKDMEVQAEPAAAVVPMVRAGFGKLSELDAFLQQCTPLLESQLRRNLTSRAFEGHDVSWEEQHDQVSCLHSLRHQGALASASPEACTAVAWNAPGTVIAAAYGALDRNDWPHTPSMLCCWSVFRRSLDPAKADVAIELPGCLTCLAFHPEDPSLLAGGAYNGDVFLWRIGEKGGDPLVAKPVLTNYAHHEPVLQMAWTRDPQRGSGARCVGGGAARCADSPHRRRLRSFVLATVSADGKLLLWNPSKQMAQPSLGFTIRPPQPAGSRAMHGSRLLPLVQTMPMRCMHKCGGAAAAETHALVFVLSAGRQN